MAAGLDLFGNWLWLADVALAEKSRIHRKASAARSISRMWKMPGVRWWRWCPAGLVPPPIMVVTPLAKASSICCGQMKWIWQSKPAVTDHASPAITSVAAPMTIGDVRAERPGCRPCRSSRCDRFEADIGFQDASFASTISALVMMVSATLAAGSCDWPMPSRMTLPPPNLTFAVGGEVALDLDESSVSANRTRSPVVGPNISA